MTGCCRAAGGWPDLPALLHRAEPRPVGVPLPGRAGLPDRDGQQPQQHHQPRPAGPGGRHALGGKMMRIVLLVSEGCLQQKLQSIPCCGS